MQSKFLLAINPFGRSDQVYSAVDLTPVSEKRDREGWPTSPQRITPSPIWFAGDFFFLSVPIGFIVLAFLAWRLDGQQLSDYGRRIQTASLLGPTVYPLVFAAIGGRTLRKIALWKAEQGTTLDILEQLFHGQSLVAYLSHVISVRRPTFLTIFLLLLWSLSPIGGQSALRVVSESNATIVVVHPVNGNLRPAILSQNSAVVATSLMMSSELDNATVDAWSHPKVPRLESIENDIDDPSWVTLNHSEPYNYASMNGIPIMGLRPGLVADFTVPYEYLTFNCSLVGQFGGFPSGRPLEKDVLTYLQYLGSKLHANISEITSRPTPTGETSKRSSLYFHVGEIATYTSTFYMFGANNSPNNESDSPADTLLYGSLNQWGEDILYECSMRNISVESNIVCHSDQCAVQRLRRMPKLNGEPGGAPHFVMRSGFVNSVFVTNVPSILPISANPHPVDSYVYGEAPWSENRWIHAPSPHVWPNVSTLGISHRLTRFLNTYWEVSRWGKTVNRKDLYTPPKSQDWVIEAEYVVSEQFFMNTTDAEFTSQISVYKAHVPWIVTLILCSVVLLLLNLISLVLLFVVTVPDIFNYISTPSRDNAFFPTPPGGSTLDGASRSRLLKNGQVQLGDIDAEKDVGYVAFRRVENAEDRTRGRVSRSRLYL